MRRQLALVRSTPPCSLSPSSLSRALRSSHAARPRSLSQHLGLVWSQHRKMCRRAAGMPICCATVCGAGRWGTGPLIQRASPSGTPPARAAARPALVRIPGRNCPATIAVPARANMQVPLTVSFKGVPVSEPIRAACWEEAEKLERYYDRITSCHVTVGLPARRRKGNHFDIHVRLSVPGGEVVVSHTPSEHASDESPQLAVRDAFD